MSIEGKKKEIKEFSNFPKFVGLFESRAVAINPDAEEYEKLMGYAPKEDSKQFEYLGESKEGNILLRMDIWLEETKIRNIDVEENGELVNKPVNVKFKVTYFLEDKEKENKDNTRKQYINSVGVCSWADDPNNLPDWFKERDYRIANVGEEQLYNFVRKWLGNLDYRSAETTLDIDTNWKKFKRGNVSPLVGEINGEWCTNIVPMATISVSEKDGHPVEYQRVYNDAFMSPYSLKFFRTIDFSDQATIDRLKAKKPRELKDHEKFVLNITDSLYGSKDYFVLKDMELYDSSKNIVASDKVISAESPDF
jgi:hypothetical protein